MHFCFHCGKELPEGSGFCPYCGTQLTYSAPQKPATPVYEQPACQIPVYQPVQPPACAQAPVYSQPVQQPICPQPGYAVPAYQPLVPPAPSQPTIGARVMGYIAMGLGISPFVLGFLMLISFSQFLDGLPEVFAFLGLGCGIPAKILASRAVAGGFRSAPPRLGSVFGIIAIVLGSIFFTVAFL